MENKIINFENKGSNICKIEYQNRVLCHGCMFTDIRNIDLALCRDCNDSIIYKDLSDIYDHFKRNHEARMTVPKELTDKYGVGLCYLVFKDVYKANLEALTTEIQRAGYIYVFVTTGSLDYIHN